MRAPSRVAPARSAPSAARRAATARGVASGAVVRRSRQCSSSTSSTLTMFAGRGAGSPYASGSPAASTSHGSSSRPSTHGQPSRIARERGSQPSSVGWRVPKTRYSSPSAPGDERVLELVRAVDHAVARPELVDVPVLPREARACEDEVDLLGGSVRVRRRRQPARRDPHAVDADAARSGRVAEPLPDRVHLALGAAVGVDVVPVRERHGARVCQSVKQSGPPPAPGERSRAGRPIAATTTASASASISAPASSEAATRVREQLAPAEPPAVGRGEHGHEHAQPERAAELVRDVDEPRRGAGVLGRDARDARRGQRRERGAGTDAEDDHRQRDPRQVRRAGRDLAEPRHADERRAHAAGEQPGVAEPRRRAAGRRAPSRTSRRVIGRNARPASSGL